MSEPGATIVIPCYNHGAFVGEAVASALAQEGARTSVVVVDDGSDDGSTPEACDACRGERVEVIHQANLGLPAARNRGAAQAKTEFLVFLDADDVIEPAFVARLGEAIASEGAGGSGGPESDVSHAYCRERLTGRGFGVWRVPEWDPVLMMITNLHPVTSLVRRDRFEVVGGFNESMRGGYEDWDLWLKFVERGWRGVRVPEPLFVWRRHSDETMVMRSRENHEALYAQLVENHRALYEERADELLLRMNVMLREFNVNWLDESGAPISQIHQRRRVRRLRRRLREAEAKLNEQADPRRGRLGRALRVLLGRDQNAG